MTRIAVFPGSFDPITKGHEDLIRRSLPLFDKVIVAIGVNSEKKYMFPLEKRINWIKKTFANETNLEVFSYEGLTVDYCRNIGAQYIIRGLRNPNDFEFEKSIAQMNRELAPQIETVSLITNPRYASYSSTIVRDVLRNHGDAQQFIPNAIDIHADD